MVEEKVTILALLKDNFSGPLKKLTRGLGGLFRLLTGATKLLAAPFVLLTKGITSLLGSLVSLQALLIGGGAAGIIAVFGKFEEQMLQVATLVDTTAISIGNLGDEIQRIAVSSGDNLSSLTKGLFDLISAGVDASEATKTLDAAARLAAAGGTTTADAVLGLTKVMNAYGLSADSATEISDSLFKAMEGGQTTIGELSRGIGLVAPSAAATGLSIDELTGSIAALTKGGLSTGIAIQSLNSFLTGIIKPTAEAEEAAAKYRVELTTTALRSKGFLGFIKSLQEATNGNVEALSELIPNTKALRVALILGAREAEVFAEQMGKMAEKAGATDVAFEKVASGLFFKLRQVKNLFLSILITIGEAAKPILDDIIGSPESGKGLAGFLQKILDSRNQVQSVVAGIAESVKLLGAVIKEAFNAGDITTLLVNAFASALTAVAQTIVAALPLLLSTVVFVGEEIAKALIRSFVGTTRKQLVALIAQGGIGGFIGARLTELGLTDVDATSIKDQADAVAAIDDQLVKIAQTLATSPEVRQLLGMSMIAPITSTGTLRLSQDLSAEQVEKVVAFANERGLGKVRQLIAQKKGIFDNMIGEPAIADSVSRATPLVKTAAEFFVSSAGDIIDSAISRLGVGLQEPTTNAIDALMKFITEEIPKRFKAAGVEDAAAKAGREAAGAAGKGVKGISVPGAPDTGTEDSDGPQEFSLERFNEGLKESISLFNDWKTVGAAAGQALMSGISGAIDVIFSANASWSEFARNFLTSIAKMILQMAIFRVISGAFSGGSPATTTTATNAGQNASLSKGGGFRDFNKGGIPGFNDGTEFVPGKRGANEDSVLARLTIGEAITQRPSVDYYGRDLMSAINKRLIPREGIRALMGAASASGAAMVQRRFNTGGTVGASGVSTEGVGPTVLPVMPVSDDNVETLLSGGAEGAFRFFGDNRENILAALNINNRDVI